MTNKIHSWERLEGEPNFWHRRFEFFLGMGSDRSLLATYRAWTANKAEKARNRQAQSAPGSWRQVAEKWHWFERAAAFDQFLSEKRAAGTEEALREALQVLQNAAIKAAKIIVRGLEDPTVKELDGGKIVIIASITKEQLGAAEAVLDRVGVPRATRQEIDLGNQKVKGYIEISPDDWDDDADPD